MKVDLPKEVSVFQDLFDLGCNIEYKLTLDVDGEMQYCAVLNCEDREYISSGSDSPVEAVDGALQARRDFLSKLQTIQRINNATKE